MGPSQNDDHTAERQLSRRGFRGQVMSAAAGSGMLMRPQPNLAQEVACDAPKECGERYKIGVCDWMILKRQKLGAFQLTKDIGADGVEVDIGSLGQRDTFENALADAKVREQFLDAARNLKVENCSLAMSAFYAQSFAERPTVPRMMQDCIETMLLMM